MQSRTQETWDAWVASVAPWTLRDDGTWCIVVFGRIKDNEIPESPNLPRPYYLGGCI